MVKYSESQQLTNDQLDRTFSALSDPTRRAILARLANGEAQVNDIAAPFGISLPAISKHLKVLEKANLIVRHKDGRLRRCHLTAGPLESAAEWIHFYHQFWGTQLDSLASYLDNSPTSDSK
ncbi:Transcriptional regulator, ArsR family [hydrothermal vent metagenome]|uniref:Transcriptional regulator, ArsR family n=1 Tax=hydrothermal vent metagenome TaxID=652676 RepID=A0A3B1AAM2_9ZZZZ